MTRIAHLSDLHLLEDDWRSRSGLSRYRLAFLSTGVELNAAERRARALWALRQALYQDVDHVLLTGDLTEDGSLDQYEALAEVLEASRLPAERVTLVPGNHDTYDGRTAWQEALEGPLSAYCATSEADAVTVVGDAVIKPISTVIEGQRFTNAAGVIRDAAVSAVRELAADPVTRGRTLIVAQHHAPLGGANRLWNCVDGTLRTGAMRSLLNDLAQAHVVHGHVHRETTLSLFGRSHAQVFSVESSRDSSAPLRIYRAEGGALLPDARIGFEPPMSATPSGSFAPACA